MTERSLRTHPHPSVHVLAAFLVLSSLADRWDEEEENEVLPFSEAVKLEPGRRGAFLPGVLRSYAIQDHPLYADAFEVGQRSFLSCTAHPLASSSRASLCCGSI